VRTSLQDHTTTVKKLAQIAYSDLPDVYQERYTYDAFVQSLNDLGLQHQLQARGVTTIEDALCKGEAYLLAKQLYRAHLSSQQVTVELKEDRHEPGHLTQVATTTTHDPLEMEVDRMTDMLEKLVTVFARSNPADLARRPLRSKVEPPKVDCSVLGVRRPRTPLRKLYPI